MTLPARRRLQPDVIELDEGELQLVFDILPCKIARALLIHVSAPITKARRQFSMLLPVWCLIGGTRIYSDIHMPATPFDELIHVGRNDCHRAWVSYGLKDRIAGQKRSLSETPCREQFFSPL